MTMFRGGARIWELVQSAGEYRDELMSTRELLPDYGHDFRSLEPVSIGRRGHDRNQAMTGGTVPPRHHRPRRPPWRGPPPDDTHAAFLRGLRQYGYVVRDEARR